VAAQLGRPLRVLLLIEKDPAKRAAIIAALAGPERAFDAVASASEALAALRERSYQGVVVDIDLPDGDGMALLEQIRGDPALARLPAVLYSERALDTETLARIARLDAGVLGDSARSIQADEVAAFLQRVKTGMPPVSAVPAPLPAADGPDCLRAKCALIVDDDARNLFALTGLLESHGMQVIAVDGGDEAIRQLELMPAIDIVLMDIMMPDMDGYETMRRIRADARFVRLPIIALTAKAMPDDRSKCLAAGASDYASKPVDGEQLIRQLRVWLGPARTGAAQAPPVP
jgi:CheY-like chemotaxis protein